MDLPHATIEEFAADGYTPIECYCPHCREIRLRPISWLPVSRLASPSLSFQPDYAVWSAEVLLRSAKPWRHKVNDVK